MAEGIVQLLLGSLFDTIDDGLVLVDNQGGILLANRWMAERFAANMPLIGQDVDTVLYDDPRMVASFRAAGILAHDSFHTEYPRRLAGGGEQWLELSTHKVRQPGGAAVGTIVHLHDVTARKRARDTLVDEVCRWRTMVEQSRDGIVVLDENGDVSECNQAFAHMLGYSLEEAYRLHVWDWEFSMPKQAVLEMLKHVDSRGDHFETTHRRKDGTTYEVEISSNGAVFDGQKQVFCVCRDISEKKTMQERIRQLAIRDPLTGIFNRRYIFERLTEIAAEYARGGADFCVSILDLDYFKHVNDVHGHLVGDFVLREFARAVASAIRPYDLLGRYGGEEFVIVSRNASWCETTAMVERVMGLVRARGFTLDQVTVRLSFSCGVADSSEFPRSDFSIEEMVKLADDRLYAGKQAGRNLCIGPRESTRHPATGERTSSP